MFSGILHSKRHEQYSSDNAAKIVRAVPRISKCMSDVCFPHYKFYMNYIKFFSKYTEEILNECKYLKKGFSNL